MAEFYDVTTWNEKIHFQTGGTRSKSIVEGPNGKLYYFKTSLKKEVIDYKYEFWSEIIASEIGRSLGFNVLKYDIAYNKDEIGCISESMINSDNETLSEGKNYLVGYDSTYNPDDKLMKKRYTFSFIYKALKDYGLEKHIYRIINVVIFDSIIGNGDRHQENWGFIIPNSNSRLKQKHRIYNSKLFHWVAEFIIWLHSKKSERKAIQKHLNLGRGSIADLLIEELKGKFSPIYDSGSCLAREFSDEKVRGILNDEGALNTYIDKGRSEIHWEGRKINHFELIRKIKQQYPDFVVSEIKKVFANVNIENLGFIINNIDNSLPDNLRQYAMPSERKDMIVKIIKLRLSKLKEILE